MRILTIIIPVFNEAPSIAKVLNNVTQTTLGAQWKAELIVVDDGSNDGSYDIIDTYIKEHPDFNIKLLKHEINKGKGMGIQTALKKATGDYVLIQDADFEYDPNDYAELLTPIEKGYANVVYGSRFVGSKPHRILLFYHYMGNRFLTFLSNIFTNLNLTDMEVGYKVFSRELLKDIRLKEKSFGFEPEVTAKISRKKDLRLYEVGISYFGRSYAEGKKINWKDGIHAIYCVLKYNLWSRR